MKPIKRKLRAQPELSQQDVLDMLASALNYCQQAGLRIAVTSSRSSKTGQGVLLFGLHGATRVQESGGYRFVVDSRPPVTATGGRPRQLPATPVDSMPSPQPQTEEENDESRSNTG